MDGVIFLHQRISKGKLSPISLSFFSLFLFTHFYSLRWMVHHLSLEIKREYVTTVMPTAFIEDRQNNFSRTIQNKRTVM